MSSTNSPRPHIAMVIPWLTIGSSKFCQLTFLSSGFLSFPLLLDILSFRLVDENGATYDRLHLKDWFNNPHPLLKADVLDGVLRGLTLANPEASDEHFVTDVVFASMSI